MTLQILLLTALILFGLAFILRQKNGAAQERLSILVEDDPNTSATSNIFQWKKAQQVLSTHNDLLGKAGLFRKDERLRATLTLSLIAVTLLACGIAIGLTSDSAKGIFLGVFVGGYGGALACWSYLRQLQSDYHRRVLFSLPLTLESMILLVETGLGILPAIEQLVRTAREGDRANPVTQLLEIVYDFSSNGMELGESLELVAHASPIGAVRHTLLHLDLSGNEGGEIIPSLRSLSDHAHKEWRLSVEHRVRRLENLVVFPVFVSVIGLLLLTAAVPLVPVLELRKSLKHSGFSNATSSAPLSTSEFKR